MYLRCHIIETSYLWPKNLISVKFSCNSKINKLKNIIFINHDIFGLEITVCNTFSMAVYNSIYQLLEVVSSKILLKCTCLLNYLKNFSPFAIFKSYIFDLFSFFDTVVTKCSNFIVVVIKYLANIFMLVEQFQDLSFAKVNASFCILTFIIENF